MEKTNVAIVGMGTVGAGVARLLLDHGDRTARHAGRTLWLEKVVVQDLAKPRNVDLPKGVLTNDLADVLNDPSIEVVAQLIGGLEPARSIMLKLLESGKDVVTANKALLAEFGPELFDRSPWRKMSNCSLLTLLKVTPSPPSTTSFSRMAMAKCATCNTSRPISLA